MGFEYKSFSPDYHCPVIQGNGTIINSVSVFPNVDIVCIGDNSYSLRDIRKIEEVDSNFPMTICKYSDGELNFVSYVIARKLDLPSDGTLTRELRRIKELELAQEEKNPKYRESVLVI